MKRIEINGMTLEFEDSLDVEIAEGKITIKSKPAETHIHYHYYSQPWQQPLQPWMSTYPQIYPQITWKVSAWDSVTAMPCFAG